MKKGALCASVLVCLFLLPALLPAGSRAAHNTDAYFVDSEFRERAVKEEDSASNDYLWARVALEVNVSGFYNLTADLTSGQKGISTAYNNSFLSPGLHFIELRFKNRDIYLSRAVGNYIVNLSLLTPNFPRMDPVEKAYQTSFYHYSDFNPDSFAPSPSGSEYSYQDGSNLTVRNNYMVLVFEKSRASITYYFTRDERAGRNGRFEVSFLRVLGWQAGPFSYFSPNDTIYSADFVNARWRTTMLENGTHHLYGPYMRFNITYTMDLFDVRLNQVASVLEVTFSLYFTGNAHPSKDRLLMIPGSTQVELGITMSLSNTISGTGLVLEQTLRDLTGNHDYLLRDQIGDFRYNGKAGKQVLPLTPRAPDSIPKVSFINKWDGLTYGIYSWGTPAASTVGNSSRAINIDVSFRPEGRTLRLFQAFHTQGTYISIDGVGFLGLEGTTPPGRPPPPQEPERHDPFLYLLGSGLALAIIFLTMRLRTRSFVKEEEQIERIEELELSEAETFSSQPVSIEEKAIGEEEEWRRKIKAKEEAPSGGTDARKDDDGQEAKPKTSGEDKAPPRKGKGQASGAERKAGKGKEVAR
jgi:hypothetical protein